MTPANPILSARRQVVPILACALLALAVSAPAWAEDSKAASGRPAAGGAAPQGRTSFAEAG
jgi:uncharacterized membrane protein